MPLLAVILLVIAVAFPARASTAEVLDSDPCLMPAFAHLLLGAHGESEVAAFITDDDGSLAFLVWPVMRWVRSQNYHGMIPPRTLAVVHTHPGDEAPSARDVAEAERLQLPFYVVTHRSVWVIDPETEPRVRRVADAGWLAVTPAPLPRECAPLRVAC